jgi:hypothetical protein
MLLFLFMLKDESIVVFCAFSKKKFKKTPQRFHFVLSQKKKLKDEEKLAKIHFSQSSRRLKLSVLRYMEVDVGDKT